MGTHPIFESDFDCLTEKLGSKKVKMSETEQWADDVEQTTEMPSVKLFGRWTTDDVQVQDISLTDYLACKDRYAKFLPHTSGRYQVKRFRKAQCPIVERLVNSLMMHGRNNGKKLMTVRIVKHASEIINLTTGENPMKILLVLVVPVQSDGKPLMYHHSDVSTKPSGFSALVLMKLPSETSRPLLNVCLTSSSMPPRDHPTPMPSRRRTNSNVSPNLTDKWVNPYILFLYYFQ